MVDVYCLTFLRVAWRNRVQFHIEYAKEISNGESIDKYTLNVG